MAFPDVFGAAITRFALVAEFPVLDKPIKLCASFIPFCCLSLIPVRLPPVSAAVFNIATAWAALSIFV